MHISILAEISERGTSRKINNNIHCEEIGLLSKIHDLHFRRCRNILSPYEVDEVGYVFVNGWFDINVFLSCILSQNISLDGAIDPCECSRNIHPYSSAPG